MRVRRPRRPGRRTGERGSAAAEYAMVSGLVVLFFLAAFQLGLSLYIRNTLIAHAAEGARYGARADSTPSDGAERARKLIRSSVRASYADNVSASRTTTSDGTAVVQVRVVAPLPVVGPWGPSGELKVTGRAYAEDQ